MVDIVNEQGELLFQLEEEVVQKLDWLAQLRGIDFEEMLAQALQSVVDENGIYNPEVETQQLIHNPLLRPHMPKMPEPAEEDIDTSPEDEGME